MVTRELRSDAAGRELVERLIAAAGGVAGLVLGVVYVLLLLCAVWAVVVITSDGMPYFNTVTLQGSMFYQFFSRYNPFV